MANIDPPVATDQSLQGVIKTRQFVLIALSSSIGAGILIATYSSLARGGPGSLLISFGVVGCAVWITMCALGELSMAFPVKGSFYEYSIRFISPAWGFAMGWNYAINFLATVVFELVVLVMCIDYWDSNLVAYYLLPALIGSLAALNAFGAGWYAEAENVFAIFKMTVLSTFIVVAALLVGNAIPIETLPREDLGARLWKRDAFKNGSAGFLFTFMNAGMAYGGTEMLGLLAAECESPQRAMRLASKIVPTRIVWLYLLPIVMLGFVLDIPRDERLQSSKLSPFVIAMDQAGLAILGTIFNGIIAVAVFSMANASVFASSRVLHIISKQGMGPPLFAKIIWGRPIWALTFVFMVSFLSFVALVGGGDQVFYWILALAAGSNYFTWISICICHMRLRMAIRKMKLNRDNILKWKSPPGIPGSVVAILVFIFGLVAQIVAALGDPGPATLIASMLGIIIVIFFWAVYTVIKRTQLIIPLNGIDLKPASEESVMSFHGGSDIEMGESRGTIGMEDDTRGRAYGRRDDT
ncbi:hypothetical protein AAE478_007190 [Parahypoxylon ruwenzoriense]